MPSPTLEKLLERRKKLLKEYRKVALLKVKLEAKLATVNDQIKKKKEGK